MDFWSKGLGKRTVRLYLRDGKVAKSGDRLYVSGRMDEPMSWDFIMPLEAADFAEFMALLREPQVASLLYHSPRRGALYRTMVVGGSKLVIGLLVALVRHARGLDQGVAEPTIEVPPPRERKPRSAAGRNRLEHRRRLNRPRRTPAEGTDGATSEVTAPVEAQIAGPAAAEG
jgi:hypothetical protein